RLWHSASTKFLLTIFVVLICERAAFTAITGDEENRFLQLLKRLMALQPRTEDTNIEPCPRPKPFDARIVRFLGHFESPASLVSSVQELLVPGPWFTSRGTCCIK
ncbi:hypothetical protein H0H93_007082, partial [Arthromyces matolae]